jgi:D-alanine--poly(phosphoribitol) ligase subunit 1
MYESFENLIKSTKTTLIFGDDKGILTREEGLDLVNNIANQIYQNLQKTELEQNPIAILLPRNNFYIASIFAVWQIGDYFIPLNLDWPIDHVNKILELCEPSLVLVESKNELIKAKQLVIDKDAFQTKNDDLWDKKRQKDGLAYVIFTSGSTGEQKGVAINKKAYNSYIAWVRDYFSDYSDNKKLLITAELTFDITLGDIAFSLAHDVELHVSPSSQNIIMHATLIKNRNIDTLYSVPSTINRLYSWLNQRKSDVMKNVRLVKSGGDTFSVDLIRMVKALSPKASFFNVYGPTEFTINCCALRVDNIIDDIIKLKNVPIGKPFDHLDTKLLSEDKNGLHSFENDIGELVVAGEQSMDGYLNDEKKTIKSFIEFEGKSYYRTGDLVQRKNDYLLIIGRIDNLVKIKGYRINPSEIENIISKIDTVNEVKVILVDKDLEPKLISFIVSVDADAGKIMDYCLSNLPSYMVPYKIIFIDKLPTGISGKYDVSQLEKIWSENEYG